MSKCDDLRLLVKLALDHQSLLRAMKIQAPSVPVTRWLYIVELLDFVALHREEILDFVRRNPECDTKIIGCEINEACFHMDCLTAILKPLHNMSLHLEDEKVRLADVIPAVIACINEWKDGVTSVLHNQTRHLAVFGGRNLLD